jgi:hypothetical protein
VLEYGVDNKGEEVMTAIEGQAGSKSGAWIVLMKKVFPERMTIKKGRLSRLSCIQGKECREG